MGMVITALIGFALIFGLGSAFVMLKIAIGVVLIVWAVNKVFGTKKKNPEEW